MRHCWLLILVGLAVVLFDLRTDLTLGGHTLANADVAPDPLGYVLMAAGLWSLRKLEPMLGAALIVSAVLAVASVFDVSRPLVEVVRLMGYSSGAREVTRALAPRFPVVVIGLVIGEAGIVWTLLGGIRRLALGRARMDFAKHAHSIYGLFLTISLFWLVYWVIQYNAAHWNMAMLIPLYVFHYLAVLLVLGTVLRAWRRHEAMLPYWYLERQAAGEWPAA